MNTNGIIIVLYGPSTSGKTTISSRIQILCETINI